MSIFNKCVGVEIAKLLLMLAIHSLSGIRE